MRTPIGSLSIAARDTLDKDSLNNEGGEGNQIQTRMVDIVDHKGELHNVNAISGTCSNMYLWSTIISKHVRSIFLYVKAVSALMSIVSTLTTSFLKALQRKITSS